MSTTERVTVTLPIEIVREIDRFEKNRSKFIQAAARSELERRRRERLQRSLQQPNPTSVDLIDAGFEEWASSLPDEDVGDLVDARLGIDVRWIEGEGWTRVQV